MSIIMFRIIWIDVLCVEQIIQDLSYHHTVA